VLVRRPLRPNQSQPLDLPDWCRYGGTLNRYSECLLQPRFAGHPQAAATAKRSAAQAAATTVAAAQHHFGPARLGSMTSGSLGRLLGGRPISAPILAACSANSVAAPALATDAAVATGARTASRLLLSAATALRLVHAAGGGAGDVLAEARRLADWMAGGSGAGQAYEASAEDATGLGGGGVLAAAGALAGAACDVAAAASEAAVRAAEHDTARARADALREAESLHGPGAAAGRGSAACGSTLVLPGSLVVGGVGSGGSCARGGRLSPYSTGGRAGARVLDLSGGLAPSPASDDCSAASSSDGSSDEDDGACRDGPAAPARSPRPPAVPRRGPDLDACALDTLRDPALSHHRGMSLAAAACEAAVERHRCAVMAGRPRAFPSAAGAAEAAAGGPAREQAPPGAMCWVAVRGGLERASRALGAEAAARRGRVAAALEAERAQAGAVAAAAAARGPPSPAPPSCRRRGSLRRGSDNGTPAPGADDGLPALLHRTRSAETRSLGGAAPPPPPPSVASPPRRCSSAASALLPPAPRAVTPPRLPEAAASSPSGASTVTADSPPPSTCSSGGRATRTRRVRFSVSALESAPAVAAAEASTLPAWHTAVAAAVRAALDDASGRAPPLPTSGLAMLAEVLAPPPEALSVAPVS